MKRPSFQFYPGDWQKDAALRMCSVSARGLWIDMLCIMHQGSPYGYLKVNEKVIHVDNLARMVGATTQEVQGWLQELEGAGVFSRDDSGCIISKRMIRDEQVRSARAAGGVLGGNPHLKNAPEKVVAKVNHPANLEPTPSSSSSSSTSVSKDLSGKPDEPRPNHNKEAVEILSFLNEKTGRRYQPVNENIKLITARLKGGASVSECRQVIARKTREWKSNPDMEKYLRPATLFNATKFAQYVGELVPPNPSGAPQ